jgi:alpha-D-ribose 1-methylphosphonate 5-triphosphate synthase subunit PhnG
MTSESARRDALAVLARATPQELADPLAREWPELGVRDLRPAETGLVMLRGRAGGDGAVFNLGEATVSRAVVELETGERGFGHRLGRDAEQARRIAIFDALWRRERERVQQLVLAPIAERLSAERARAAAQTAATRVDFFTLVRGEA